MLRSLLCVVVLQYTYSLVLPPTPRSPHTLHEAAAEGDADTAAMLLFAGESSEARNAKASTPLHLAAFKGHDAVAQVLLDYGAATDAVKHNLKAPCAVENHAARRNVTTCGRRRTTGAAAVPAPAAIAPAAANALRIVRVPVQHVLQTL